MAPVITLLTGLLALHDFGDNSDTPQDILQLLTLGSTFTTATLDVHDRHFLFGSDNVDSVREMTLNTLVVQSRAALNPPPARVEDAVRILIDNQAICTPPHILHLARQAIAHSSPQAVDESGRNLGGAPAPVVTPPPPIQGDQEGQRSSDGRVTANIPPPPQ